MCIAAFKDITHRTKLANRGTPGIWVGYAEIHPTGTYHIFNPKIKRIILTCNVTFLNKSYGEYNKVEKPTILKTSYEGSDEEEEFETVSKNDNNGDINIVSDSDSDLSDDDLENNEENFFDEDADKQVIALHKPTINTKVIRAMKKLQASFNDDANKIIKEGTHVKTTENLNFLIDLAMITTESVSVPEEPTSFHEA